MPGLRYPDEFRNALMASHAISVHAELWYGVGATAAKVSDLNIVAGSVSADRGGSVRRRANLTIDPSVLTDPAIASKLKPFGSTLKIWRGIRYADNRPDDILIFTGRIDTVTDSLAGGVSIGASDWAAHVVDSRFEKRTTPASYGLDRGKILDVIAAIIKEAIPTATVDDSDIKDATLRAATVAPGTGWDAERSDALDQLCTQIQAEWLCDMTGVFRIRPLPALRSGSLPVSWIIDGGDEGVLIERTRTLDRANVFNQAVVTGEAIGGSREAYGHYELTEDDDKVLFWGGPYGKIPRFYSGQQVRSTAAAMALAKTLVTDAKSAVSSLQVECVPNPKLQLGDVVRIFDGRGLIDAMFFVQQIELPLDPETPMRLTVYDSLIATAPAAKGADVEPVAGIRPDPRRLPEGANWTPDVPR